ncbi:hypothetical protein CUMW_276860 [Citrus unshiu]|uniref:Peptidase A1 domain-containing protein n=1 Tax=Citrus unshiu TaxID=55188 RepID=A0A2H5N2Q8_CITUN|nr:hypothetical protein CUMW_276860 [Citrus unshiu]
MSMKFLGIQIAVAIYIYVLTLTSKINGFRIELTPRTSIDSALFPKDLSPEEIHHRIAQLSRVRALQLGSKQEPETLKPPVYPSPFANTNIYITKISIGSTQFSPYLVVDTGSDDTWLQCEGCTSLCSYDWKYKEGSAIKGVLSSESFTFPGDKNTSLAFANVTFGCGYDNQNVSFGGYMGRVFGLGAGATINPEAIGAWTNLRFSYLSSLVPHNRRSNHYLLGYLALDAQIKETKTKKFNNKNEPQGLPGISIEGNDSEIKPALFSAETRRLW